jgi:hypothetical protein
MAAFEHPRIRVSKANPMIEYEQDGISGIIESAFDILGGKSKERLYQHARQEYNIDIESATKSDMGQIHRAIVDLFGRDAAQLLMKRVYLLLASQ